MTEQQPFLIRTISQDIKITEEICNRDYEDGKAMASYKVDELRKFMPSNISVSWWSHFIDKYTVHFYYYIEKEE